MLVILKMPGIRLNNMFKHQVLNREVRSRVDTGGRRVGRRGELMRVKGVRASSKHHPKALG